MINRTYLFLPRASRPQSLIGLSLLEVTMALTVLLAALLVVVGQFANVHNIQHSTQTVSAAERILQSLVERVNSVAWADLGTTNAPWSLARYEVSTNGPGLPPMDETTPASDPYYADVNLSAVGLITKTTGLSDIKIWVEYWRATTYRDENGDADSTKLGALELSYTSAEAFRTAVYIDPTKPEDGLKAAYRFSTWSVPSTRSAATAASSPVNQVGPNDPLLVRIIATWDKGQQRRELFTSRAP